MVEFFKKKSIIENPKSTYSLLAGCKFPVYISSDLKPVFSLKTGSNRNKTVVTTIPKSGTYLISELIKHAGFELVRLNIRKNSVRDFRFKDLNDFTNLDQQFPLENTTKLILPGQVTAGHIEFDEYTQKSLSEFKKIFAYRNMRDCLVSAMRHGEKWAIDPADRESLKKMEEGPEKLLHYMKLKLCKNFFRTSSNVIGWIDDTNTFKISYEDLLGDFGEQKRKEKIIQLFRFLDCEIGEEQIHQILNQTFSSKTLTKSGNRTKIEKFWNESVENEFVKIGFGKLNSKLGY